MVKQTRIGDITIEYETCYRPVKYPRLEFRTGRLVMILPESFHGEKELLKKKEDWILKKAKEINEAKRRARERYGSSKAEISLDELKPLVESLARGHSEKLKVGLNQVFFRDMKTKWGSCSDKRNLTFNTKLRFLPRNLIEYVVFHEMLHLLQRKHSDGFWRMLEGRFPDPGSKEKELLEYWFYIQEFKA